ncbi:MAG: NADP-dependent malic enzyme [Leptospiraceae bacterium]|nr:NADP-dependent malic enzyme [Leptospiraceae bacterium]
MSDQKESFEIYRESVEFHHRFGGKLGLQPRQPIQTTHDLSIQYTPGVAQVCREIAQKPDLVYDLTIKKNTVAVVTDGSAVLGLGNIGPQAALPVMEGKAVLFKEYAGIDAFPICLQTQDIEEIIRTVRYIAPTFAGINLEDISAPRCFVIEERLQDLGIPVFHDDQHGTAIVLLAALINAAKIAGKRMTDLRVVINGSGAAGTSIAHLLLCIGHDPDVCEPVREVIMCDSKGIISQKRQDIQDNPAKSRLALITNRNGREGNLADAVKDCDVFVGVSAPGSLTQDMVRSMNKDPIIFAMANPVPEIMPDEARAAGALIVGTGRSDFPNQVNNVLAFPGIFRGALDSRARVITEKMKLAAARALAACVTEPTVDRVIPSPLEKDTAFKVAAAVAAAVDQDSMQRSIS